MFFLTIISILDLFFNFMPFFAKKELIETLIIISFVIYFLITNI